MRTIEAGVRRAGRRVKHAAYVAHRMVARRLAQSPDSDSVTLYPLPTVDSAWTFHDEQWVRIVDRWKHRRMLNEGRCLTVVDAAQRPDGRIISNGPDGFSIEVPAGKEDRWIYLYLNPVENAWKNFRWTFAATRMTSFRELQFGFRYVDFYNRYRFRHEDNHWHFDIVQNGKFQNSIARVLSPMELGREYRIEIVVSGRRFTLLVDGSVVLDEFDVVNRFPRGAVAIIVWEDGMEPAIHVCLRGFKIVELRKPKGVWKRFGKA